MFGEVPNIPKSLDYIQKGNITANAYAKDGESFSFDTDGYQAIGVRRVELRGDGVLYRAGSRVESGCKGLRISLVRCFG